MIETKNIFIGKFQSQVNPEIIYKIEEDFEKLNYIITFWKNGKQVEPLGEYGAHSIPEQGLEVAKEMAESTIKEYINE